MPPSPATLARIRRSLLAWYALEQRDFPWRRTHDPYAVLVSEVMLQQTQAGRVIDRYERFMQRFPTLEALAAAPTSSVLAEWNGLGYNRRALALRHAAIAVARDGWPRDVAGLQGLPGVGPYTARAIASLAFGVQTGVVDTNVRRWLMRRLGASDRPRELQALADRVAQAGGDPDASAAFTHATMEFGARVCTARSPRCESCPLARGCPSRGRNVAVPVARQPAFDGSERARRGALVRALSRASGHALRAADARAAVGGDLDARAFGRLLAGLERDGLVHRSGGLLRLGQG